MKKCMIAAIAAVVVGGAFAACNYNDPPTQPKTWAYTWKFTGKTTDGVLTKGTKGKAGNCNMGTPATAGGAVRAPASLKIQGYTAYCDVTCGSDDFEVLAECQEVFWQTKPHKVSLSGGVTTEVSNIIGKKAKQYEIAGLATFIGYADEPGMADQLKYELVFAGLGKYDFKNSRVSSASGNFAGTLEYPWYVSKDRCVYAGIWDCATITLIGEETPVDSVAFGKWNVKYNKKAAKKLRNNKAGNIYAAASVPKWVIPYNAAECE